MKEVEKKILTCMQTYNGTTMQKYEIQYQGTWKDQDLITAVDNRYINKVPTEEDLQKVRHFGGTIQRHISSDGKQMANVTVYID